MNRRTAARGQSRAMGAKVAYLVASPQGFARSVQRRAGGAIRV